MNPKKPLFLEQICGNPTIPAYRSSMVHYFAPIAADDDVVMHGYVDGFSCFAELTRYHVIFTGRFPCHHVADHEQ
jgi:hypothetical protein